MKKYFLLYSVFFLFSYEICWASSGSSRLALVYKGPGACKEGCSEAAAQVAKSAGFKVEFVGPSDIKSSLLQKASLWIQPGGDALEVRAALTDQQILELRNYVANGGRYLGFCAGAFFADTWIDNEETVPGLGLIPGVSFDYQSTGEAMIIQINWLNSQTRSLYFEAGAGFRLNENSGAQVLATYLDGIPAIISTRYQAGKVILSGPHPEAPRNWAESEELIDPDGDDSDIAAYLIFELFNNK